MVQARTEGFRANGVCNVGRELDRLQDYAEQMQRYTTAMCSLQEGTPAAGWTKKHLGIVLAKWVSL